jgi:hypothetical protein
VRYQVMLRTFQPQLYRIGWFGIMHGKSQQPQIATV